MLSLSDTELAFAMRIAENLLIDRRVEFLERIAAYLQLHGDYDAAADVIELAINAALRDITRSAA